jgi:hypothetical protein
MNWGSDDNPSTDSGARDNRDGAPSAKPASATDAANPLSLLARKLGALEQSLTVVASEIGVSGMPQFKHLDADKVYAEAMRVARQAAAQAQKELDDRTREVAASTAVLGVRLDSELQTLIGRIGDLDTRLDALSQQVEALRQQGQEQAQTAAALAALQQRVEALTGKAQPVADSSATAALRQRLDAVEAQLQARPAVLPDNGAEWPFAEDGSPRQAAPSGAHQVDTATLQRDIEAAIRQHLPQIAGELEARLLGQIEKRLDQGESAAAAGFATANDALFVDSPARYVNAADIKGLPEMIATEMAALLSRRAERNEQTALLAESNSEINPLVMTATERAIVRLTHRIEKLEGHLEGNSSSDSRRSSSVRPGTRPSRGFVGRLFEG